LPVTTLWLRFAAANPESWQTTHVPLGLGATALGLVIAFRFVVRRKSLGTSRSPLVVRVSGGGRSGRDWVSQYTVGVRVVAQGRWLLRGPAYRARAATVRRRLVTRIV
jgi:hypothetical protein